VIGYLNRYSLSKTEQWIRINPFGNNGFTLNEYGNRAGNITIKLENVKKIEKLEDILSELNK